MRKVQTKTRQPNIFSALLSRNPDTGEFTVIGNHAQRLIHANQYPASAKWETVAPRDLAKALRDNTVSSL